MGSLDAGRIREGLVGTVFDTDGLECLGEVASTNDLAVARGSGGAEEGGVVFAEFQTSGRGRRGDAWVSSPGENLLFSVLLRPQTPQSGWSRLTHMTALAICLGVEEFMPGLSARIKWPNDVYLGGKKLAGILIENHGGFVVIGAGVNVNGRSAEFPDEFRSSATTLREHAVDRQVLSREELAVAILGQFARMYPRLLENFVELRDSVWSRSELEGKEVRALVGAEIVVGKVRGLGSEGELVVIQADGQERVLTAADWVREI